MKKIFLVSAALALASPAWSAQQPVTTITVPASGKIDMKTYTNTHVNPRLTAAQANFTELYTLVGSGGGYSNLTEFVAQTAWRLFYSDGSGDVKELSLGSDGEYLKSNGAAIAPSWATPSGAAHDAVTLGTDAAAILGLSTQQITLESQTANYFFAAPNGSAGDPTFRAILAADLPFVFDGDAIGEVVVVQNDGGGNPSLPFTLDISDLTDTEDLLGGTVTVQSADPTSASAVGWYAATGSGDIFYKSSGGLFTVAGTYAADPTIPTLTSRVIGTNGTSLTLTGSASLSLGADADGSGFDVDCLSAGSGITATYASGAPGTDLVYTLGTTVNNGDTCDLDYDATDNTIQATTGGGLLASITSGAITNTSEQVSAVTVSQTTSTTSISNIYNGAVRGQSILVPMTGDLTKFRFRTGAAGVGGTGTATVRCGTSADLSSTTSSGTVAVSAVDTTYEVTLGTPLAVTNGSTAYCAVRNDSTTYGDRFAILWATTSVYANGQGFTATSTWNLGTGSATGDMWFEAVFE